MKKFYLAMAVLWLVLPAFAENSVTLAWDASTDQTVVGYNVYYGSSSRSYTNVVDAGAALTVSVSNLVAGTTYFFAATTYTAAGLESDYSAEVTYLVPGVANAVPTLNPLPDVLLTTNAGPQTVQLTGVTSGSTNGETLSITAFPNNSNLISIASINYTSPNTTGAVSFVSAPDGYGSSLINVLVSNGTATFARSFMVVVGTGTPPMPPVLKPLVLVGTSVALPAGSAIDLEAPNVNGVPSGSGLTYSRWLDVSGNHYDAYCYAKTAVITNVGGHQAWRIPGLNDGWVVTNSANSVVQNLTGCTMVVTLTGAATTPIQNVSYVAVPADNTSNFSWISQAFPQNDGQTSLDFRGRRLGTDAGVTVAGPGVSLGVRYVYTVTVNWAANTVTCYTNGVQLSQNTNFQTPGNSDNFGPAQGIAIMCFLQNGVPSNTFTGTLENFVLWPRVLTATELAQVYSHFQ